MYIIVVFIVGCKSTIRVCLQCLLLCVYVMLMCLIWHYSPRIGGVWLGQAQAAPLKTANLIMRYEKEAAFSNFFMVHQARNWWETGWKVEMARLPSLGCHLVFWGLCRPCSLAEGQWEQCWRVTYCLLQDLILQQTSPVPPAGPDTGLLLLLRLISSLHQHCRHSVEFK